METEPVPELTAVGRTRAGEAPAADAAAATGRRDGGGGLDSSEDDVDDVFHDESPAHTSFALTSKFAVLSFEEHTKNSR